MCRSSNRQPPPQTPAPAPPPAEPTATVAQSEPANIDTEENASLRARRRGRNGLKIDLAVGGTGGGSGLNVPT